LALVAKINIIWRRFSTKRVAILSTLIFPSIIRGIISLLCSLILARRQCSSRVLALNAACTVVQAVIMYRPYVYVNGRWRFSTLRSSETPKPISVKHKLYNYLPDTTRTQNLGGYVDVGGLGK